MEVGEGVVYPLADTVETLWPLLGYNDGSFAPGRPDVPLKFAGSSHIKLFMSGRCFKEKRARVCVHVRAREREKERERKRGGQISGESIGLFNDRVVDA